MNFGAGVFERPNTVEALSDAIAHYDATDAQIASTRLRDQADLEVFVSDLVRLYEDCLADPPLGGAPASAAMARLLEDFLPTPAKGRWAGVVQEHRLRRDT